ncbi:nuclear transport factor 2 family protein [Marmoricola sp. RAF53]|uniref:nuclear transport factor 2 family protein n=1 Tax=Marmoricola sp. RAF53 TaxID=3233059 RepID=UPI003F998E5A
MASKEEIQALVESYVAAVGRQDLEGVLAVFADDVVQEDPIGTPPNVGIDAVRGFFEKSFGMPFSTELTGPVLVTGDYAAFHFTIRIPLGEDTMVVRVIDQIRVDADGKVAELRAVVD